MTTTSPFEPTGGGPRSLKTIGGAALVAGLFALATVALVTGFGQAERDRAGSDRVPLPHQLDFDPIDPAELQGIIEHGPTDGWVQIELPTPDP